MKLRQLVGLIGLAVVAASCGGVQDSEFVVEQGEKGIVVHHGDEKTTATSCTLGMEDGTTEKMTSGEESAGLLPPKKCCDDCTDIGGGVVVCTGCRPC